MPLALHHANMAQQCHRSPQRERCLTFVLAEGVVTLVAQGDMGRFSPSLLVLHMLGFDASGLVENVQLYSPQGQVFFFSLRWTPQKQVIYH